MPNTTKYVVFPNPESTYVGFPTRYNNDCVYIIWFDAPVSPNTPDFNNLWNTNSYDVRYWDIQHSFFESTLTNPRPTLSGLNDHQLIKVPIHYVDEITGKRIRGTRVGLVLCGYSQYNYLKTYNLWNDKMNWLNWGKTKMPSLDSISAITQDLATIAKEAIAFLPELSAIIDEVIVFLQNIFGDFSGSTPIIDFLQNFLVQLQQFVDNLLPEVGNLVIDIVSNVRDIVNLLLQDLKNGRMPEYGVVFMRQLLPNPSFSKSIQSYYDANSDCIAKNISIPSSIPFQEPSVVHPFCNPGNTDYCKQYGFDPCCLSKELLQHMQQYYPRVEKVRMCDIENGGATFFDKYLYYPLPYEYDADPSIDSSQCCMDTDCKNKTRTCPFSNQCLDALRKVFYDIKDVSQYLPPAYLWLKEILDSFGNKWQDILLCKIPPEKVSQIVAQFLSAIDTAIQKIVDAGQGRWIIDRLDLIKQDLISVQQICNL